MAAHFDLDCGDRDLKAASIGYSSDGYVFRCTIDRISDDLLNRLNATVRVQGTIRLVFSQQPLLLERVAIERIEPDGIRLSGRVVDGQTTKGLLP